MDFTHNNNTLHVEVNSLQDNAAGKKLFNGHAEKLKEANQKYNGEVVTIGVLEDGCVDHSPSVVLLIRVDYSNEKGVGHFYCTAQTSGRNFLMASQDANRHLTSFLNKINPYSESHT